MTPAHMKERLKKFIFDELIYHEAPERFSDDDDLLEAGLDSMGIMRLIMFAEQAFGVTLPDTEIEPENVRSLNALEAWIGKAPRA
jgi:D-alanine--poly(phosphoribitol) ligase subunit 2